MPFKAALIAILLLALPSFPRADNGNSSFADSIKARFRDHPVLDSLIMSHVDRITVDSIESYMRQLVSFRTRFMLADNRKNIALWIGDKFNSFGYQNVEIDSFQNTVEFPFGSGKRHTTWQYNVSAALIGSENPAELYTLGAHFDCMILGPKTDPYKYAPGADNNASGVAACLEIARVLKQNHLAPEYSIEFITFGSEEFMTMFIDGKSGAEHFVEQQKRLGTNIRMMIDNNQIGFVPDNAPWKLDFQNYPGAGWVTDLAHYICENYTKIIPIDTNDHIMYTDARYFHEAGIPSIFFEEFHFNPHTFTDGDTPANCSLEYCTEVAKISCGMLVYLSF